MLIPQVSWKNISETKVPGRVYGIERFILIFNNTILFTCCIEHII